MAPRNGKQREPRACRGRWRRRGIALVVLLTAATTFATGCSTHRPENVAVGATAGKPSAPARVSAAWAADSVTISVDFLRPVEYAEVLVRGVGGLQLESQKRQLSGVSAGETARLAVAFAPPEEKTGKTPPGIAVSVRVHTGERELVAVRSFSWPDSHGHASIEKATDEADQTVRSGPDGRRIRVLPAK